MAISDDYLFLLYFSRVVVVVAAVKVTHMTTKITSSRVMVAELVEDNKEDMVLLVNIRDMPCKHFMKLAKLICCCLVHECHCDNSHWPFGPYG